MLEREMSDLGPLGGSCDVPARGRAARRVAFPRAAAATACAARGGGRPQKKATTHHHRCFHRPTVSIAIIPPSAASIGWRSFESNHCGNSNATFCKAFGRAA